MEERISFPLVSSDPKFFLPQDVTVDQYPAEEVQTIGEAKGIVQGLLNASVKGRELESVSIQEAVSNPEQKCGIFHDVADSHRNNKWPFKKVCKQKVEMKLPPQEFCYPNAVQGVKEFLGEWALVGKGHRSEPLQVSTKAQRQAAGVKGHVLLSEETTPEGRVLRVEFVAVQRGCGVSGEEVLRTLLVSFKVLGWRYKDFVLSSTIRGILSIGPTPSSSSSMPFRRSWLAEMSFWSPRS